MRKPRLLMTILVGLALVGCATAPTDRPAPAEQQASSAAASSSSASASPTGAPADYRACMVGDASGFYDGSFNQTSHEGLLRAERELGIEIGEVTAPSEAEYGAAIQSLVDADCDLVVTIGFKHADAAEAAAQANPETDFVLVDAQPSAPLPNLKPLLFDPAGASFLAGYLAAAQSTSGTVATFGAVKNADVVLFLNGFAGGVAHYNQTKDAQVQLLGWDLERQDGQFITSQMPFQDVAAGRTTADTLIGQGADVIFPVAGMAGTGALQAAAESGGRVAAIWVDTDGCLSNPDYCPVILTSVYKGMDVAVFDAIAAAAEGGFDPSPYHGTLANGGSGLSDFHDFDALVSEQTKADLAQVRDGLLDGSVTPPAAG